MAIGSVSLSRCVKQRGERRPAGQLGRNIPDAVHYDAGQSRTNTKTGRRGGLTVPSSDTQTHCCSCQFACGLAVLDCLSQSPVVSPCEWLRFSGSADIPNK